MLVTPPQRILQSNNVKQVTQYFGKNIDNWNSATHSEEEISSWNQGIGTNMQKDWIKTSYVLIFQRKRAYKNINFQLGQSH